MQAITSSGLSRNLLLLASISVSVELMKQMTSRVIINLLNFAMVAMDVCATSFYDRLVLSNFVADPDRCI